jgi:hypothetical protein
MTGPRESLINFYNPPSTTPVRIDNSHYTADPPIFPLLTHQLHCPHCRNEPLFTRLAHRNPAVDSPTAAVYASPSVDPITRTKASMA